MSVSRDRGLFALGSVCIGVSPEHALQPLLGAQLRRIEAQIYPVLGLYSQLLNCYIPCLLCR